MFLLVMRPLFLQAFVLATLVTASVPVRAIDVAEPVSLIVLEERVREFLQAFINPNQTPEEQARFVAEGAEYYRFGPTSRKAIIAEIKRYTSRWPMRSYRLLNIEYLKHDPSSDDVFVSYVVEFDVANSTARVHGQANYGAGITNVHSAPQISMIMERIRKRDY